MAPRSAGRSGLGPKTFAVFAAVLLVLGCGTTLKARLPDPYQVEGLRVTIEKARADWLDYVSVRGVAVNTGPGLRVLVLVFSLQDAEGDVIGRAIAMRTSPLAHGAHWRFEAVAMPFPVDDPKKVVEVVPQGLLLLEAGSVWPHETGPRVGVHLPELRDVGGFRIRVEEVDEGAFTSTAVVLGSIENRTGRIAKRLSIVIPLAGEQGRVLESALGFVPSLDASGKLNFRALSGVEAKRVQAVGTQLLVKRLDRETWAKLKRAFGEQDPP